MSDVTRILCEIESGDPSAAEHLLPLVLIGIGLTLGRGCTPKYCGTAEITDPDRILGSF